MNNLEETESGKEYARLRAELEALREKAPLLEGAWAGARSRIGKAKREAAAAREAYMENKSSISAIENSLSQSWARAVFAGETEETLTRWFGYGSSGVPSRYSARELSEMVRAMLITGMLSGTSIIFSGGGETFLWDSEGNVFIENQDPSIPARPVSRCLQYQVQAEFPPAWVRAAAQRSCSDSKYMGANNLPNYFLIEDRIRSAVSRLASRSPLEPHDLEVLRDVCQA